MGLLGNPSDGYGGKALAFTFDDFAATAIVEPSERVKIVAGERDMVAFASVRQAANAFALEGGSGGLRLASAALHRFFLHSPGLVELDAGDDRMRFSLRFETDIPRQVGLSGSSAIVIAVMRALMEWFDQRFDPAPLAEIALAAEVEELGLAGGPMDRVAQAYEGVVSMDLREPRTAASYARLDASVLPPLFVAWDPAGGAPSGEAHGPLRARWDKGDEELRGVMDELRDVVDAGLEALSAGDVAAFAEQMNRNFELRSRFFPISDRDRQAIRIARGAGAAAKLCGSGGAIVGLPADDGDFDLLQAAYEEAGFGMIRPRVTG